MANNWLDRAQEMAVVAPKIRNNHGKRFEREVAQRLGAIAAAWAGFYWFRIPDGIRALYRRQTSDARGHVVGIRGDTPTPADYCYALPSGKMGLIEAKTSDAPSLSICAKVGTASGGPTSYSRIRASQWNALTTLCAPPYNIETWLLWEIRRGRFEGVHLIPGMTLNAWGQGMVSLRMVDVGQIVSSGPGECKRLGAAGSNWHLDEILPVTLRPRP